MALRQRLAKKLLYNEATYRLRRLRYIHNADATGDVPLTDFANDVVAALRTHGVCRIDERFRPVADALVERVVKPLDAAPDPTDVRLAKVHAVETMEKAARPFQAMLSFRTPELQPLLLDAELSAALCHYYGKQPYFRNQPYLIRSQIGRDSDPQRFHQAKFHLDGGLHQVSYMLLLNDVSKRDTHTEYALRSPRAKPRARSIYDRDSYRDEEIEARYPLTHFVGSRGTLYLFDAGNGFHRASPAAGTTRDILHLNVTTGHEARTGPDGRRGWEGPETSPPHVRRMFDKVLQ